jgi:hypothetical protein
MLLEWSYVRAVAAAWPLVRSGVWDVVAGSACVRAVVRGAWDAVEEKPCQLTQRRYL